MSAFLETLHTQRMDDHRFYHHSRINQTLHLFSAISFLCSYVMLFVNPAIAALIAWFFSMVSRQAGHFFFEPRGYDDVNQVTDEHKEEIKVGYNIKRKIVLMSAWALIPVLLMVNPSLFGMIEPASNVQGLVNQVGLAWLALGVSALLFRVLQLAKQDSLWTGVVWATKIVTDPFHDIRMYYSAPLALLRGEMIDPMPHFRR